MIYHQVWKFPFDFNAEFTVPEWPDGAEVVHVAPQGDTVCIWALCDPEAPTGPQRFLLRGTGHCIGEENVRHVGTWLMEGGDLVWHLFQDEKIPFGR